MAALFLTFPDKKLAFLPTFLRFDGREVGGDREGIEVDTGGVATLSITGEEELLPPPCRSAVIDNWLPPVPL